MIEEQLANS